MEENFQSFIEAFLRQNLPAGMSIDDFYIILTVLIIVLIVLAFDKGTGRHNRISSRIKTIKQRAKAANDEAALPKKRKKPEASVNFMRRVSRKLQLVKKLQLERAEIILLQAGFRSRDAIAVFAFFCFITPLILFPVGILILETRTSEAALSKTLSYCAPILGLYLGLKLPWIFLGKIKKRRYRKISRSLSDTLDLMTVCAEAGLSMPAAMDRVARELAVVYPEMAEEMTLTSLEINFYPDRNRALNNLAERCDIKELKGVVTVLIQTEKYGTPIAQALRVLSAEMRKTRMLTAEGKAARLPAIMTLPMILFILPTVFIVILTPAVINGKKNLGPALSGNAR